MNPQARQGAPEPPPPFLEVAEEVQVAVREGRPVVALESTVLAHGLPWPDGLEVARRAEEVIRMAGAVPATVAVVGGRLRVGLEAATLEQVARGRFVKATVADLGPLIAAGGDGATTVSATLYAAARAGIRLFATGGIGGVHRGDPSDVSSDLTTLAREPVAVVSAGAKAILDLRRTLEYLETLAVPVIGYRTSELPAFYTNQSGLPLEHRVETPAEAAALLAAHFSLGTGRGVLIANPIPEADALEPDDFERALAAALRAAAESRLHGKQLTPFLLAAVARETGRQSVRANQALLLNNARVAAEIAAALCRLPPEGQ
ncbi:MAG: pseudouridine-5'-phosphate glycosidase [Myxococcota bacterium]|nr:pseudouridine-5'-phosphate glycosidase [Myxococcota bacterium]